MTTTRKNSKTEEKSDIKKPSFENIEFGKRIKAQRQRRELTLDELSQLTKLIDPSGEGISRVSLSRYENGTYAPGLRELKVLSQSLRLSLALLVYGDSEDPMDFYEHTIEEAIDDHVYRILAEKGLVEKTWDDVRMSDDYQALLKKVRQIP